MFVISRSSLYPGFIVERLNIFADEYVHTLTLKQYGMYINYHGMKLSWILQIGSHTQKFRLSTYAMTKMAAKRTGVIREHCSAFALFPEGFHSQTDTFITIKVKKKVG